MNLMTAYYDAMVRDSLERGSMMSPLTEEERIARSARRYRIEQGNRIRHEDILRQVAGVLANVVELHSPGTFGDCAACSAESHGHDMESEGWPCATIRLIERALG